jgi:hypothetical protein
MLGLGQIRMGAGGGASSILRPQDAFSTTLYTGTGSTRTVTTGIDLVGSGDGTKLQGGLVWTKARTAAYIHVLVDTVRGAGNQLYTNLTNAQSSVPTGLNVFSSTGFSTGAEGGTNQLGENYAAWTFRRAAKFFDIVQYTGNGASGRQVPHSLGVAPGMIIVKSTSGASNWCVYARTSATSGVHGLSLNATNAAGNTVATQVHSTSTFALDHIEDHGFSVPNLNGTSYIAYLFAHDPDTINGIIQCGNYTGNGSTTGPVVTLGWEPQYLLVKNASAAGSWILMDTARGLGVGDDKYLPPNLTNAELSSDFAETTSTGFKLTSTSAATNGSTNTYIYLAIRKATP